MTGDQGVGCGSHGFLPAEGEEETFREGVAYGYLRALKDLREATMTHGRMVEMVLNKMWYRVRDWSLAEGSHIELPPLDAPAEDFALPLPDPHLLDDLRQLPQTDEPGSPEP